MCVWFVLVFVSNMVGVCAVFVTRMFGVFVWCFGCLACVALMFFVLTCLPCSFKVCCMLLSGCGVL